MTVMNIIGTGVPGVAARSALAIAAAPFTAVAADSV
jgi:hypothetical protein